MNSIQVWAIKSPMLFTPNFINLEKTTYLINTRTFMITFPKTKQKYWIS